MSTWEVTTRNVATAQLAPSAKLGDLYDAVAALLKCAPRESSVLVRAQALIDGEYCDATVIGSWTIEAVTR